MSDVFPEFPPPLATFAGAVPPAPAWFAAAVAQQPERTAVPVEGVDIELLTWGERGRPGLLLLHGNGAHADWWAWTAPYFADTHRVAAISWSGMGGSGWRETYSGELFAREAFAGAEAAGLFEADVKPVFVGHSFGGFPMLLAAATAGERLAGVVSVDSPVRRPEAQWRGPPQRHRPNNVYPTLEAALARFRFAPPQDCETPYIADHIARASLKRAPLEDGSGEGWTWRFDPFMWREFRMEERASFLTGARCPVALMWGDRSKLVTDDTAAYMRGLAPKGTPVVVIPDADHHVMVDQPLAFVAALGGFCQLGRRDGPPRTLLGSAAPTEPARALPRVRPRPPADRAFRPALVRPGLHRGHRPRLVVGARAERPSPLGRGRPAHHQGAGRRLRPLDRARHHPGRTSRLHAVLPAR
jgi:pimeloyl-ACP methyl ester carboxylesterase